MMQDSEAPRRPGIQSIARAAQVLRALREQPAGLTLGELAAAVALPKSTVHRLVGALTSEELLDSSAEGRVVLGGGLAGLAAALHEALAARVRPVLVELSHELAETVDLAVREGASVRFLDQVPGPQRLRAVSAVGAEFPLHCTANGKALLAELPDEAVAQLLPERLPALTRRTSTSRARLLDELAEVRMQGFALDREEQTEGICAVGAAIRDRSGAVAALSVPVPSARFAGAERRCAQAVVNAARSASAILGGGG